MTYVDGGRLPSGLLVIGSLHAQISHYFNRLGQAGGAGHIEQKESPTSSRLSPREERLRLIQDTISAFSMHLPRGFASGLTRQFANLMDDDAWEDDDELVSPDALTEFILLLFYTGTKRRPGIGTNGRGSITASWTDGENRLTIECLPTKRVSLILSRRRDDGEIERAAFGPLRPERVRDILVPFNPEVWFDD